jgi:hypothetical protein
MLLNKIKMSIEFNTHIFLFEVLIPPPILPPSQPPPPLETNSTTQSTHEKRGSKDKISTKKPSAQKLQVTNLEKEKHISVDTRLKHTDSQGKIFDNNK